MLELYKKQFDEIMKISSVRKRSALLGSLMSQLEWYYKISMNTDIFERETSEDVKELYLQVSLKRVLDFPVPKSL